MLGWVIFIRNKTKVESVQLGRLLKSSIFVVQKAAAPRNGVEFHQRSIGALRCSLEFVWWVVVVVGGGGGGWWCVNLF